VLQDAGAVGLGLALSSFVAIPSGTRALGAPAAAAHALSLPLDGYDPGQRYDVQVKDVEYRRAGPEAWLARIFQPQGPGPFPALVEVHGGVWGANDRLLDTPMNQVLAASGIVVAAIDFREAPKDPYPASVADVNYATRWLKAHAAEFSADPRTVGLLGGSSGGHLAMLSAMRPRDPRYAVLPLPEAPGVDATAAYVSLHTPIVDPYARYLFAQATKRDDLIAGHLAYFEDVATMQEANPHLILERGEPAALPPTILLQGTADKNVTVAMQEEFAAAYRKAGGSIDFELFPDQPHYFANTPGPAADRALGLVKAFVAQQLAGGATRALPSTGAGGAAARPTGDLSSPEFALPWLIGGGALAIAALGANAWRRRRVA